MHPNGRNEAPIVVVIDKIFKLSLVDDDDKNTEKCEKKWKIAKLQIKKKK